MKVRVAKLLLVAFFSFPLTAQLRTPVDEVVVYKHGHKLILLSRGQQVKSYRVALGGEPVGPKTQQGDHRTPEGLYVLDSRNPNSQYYKAFHISYPNSKDIATAKRLGVSPGGDIMLHGLPKKYAWVGKSHAAHDWTDGCIAVSNEEMDELWKLIPVGTRIQIKP